MKRRLWSYGPTKKIDIPKIPHTLTITGPPYPANTMQDAYYDPQTDFDPKDFPIPLHLEGTPDASLFLPKEPDRPLNKAEKEWVKAAQNNPQVQASPPSAPALRALQSSLSKFAGPMPVSKEQWQNYVMQQYYLQSLDTDPKVSKAALDSLAKTSIVGLHEERKEITLELKSTIDLQSEALTLLRSLAQRNNEKVIEHAG